MLNWLKWLWNLNLIGLACDAVARWWTGQMTIHEIVPGLFQSSKFSEKDWNILAVNQIKAVIDLEGGADPLPDVFRDDYKYWPIRDIPQLPDLQELGLTAVWGYERWQGGKNLLVHCAAGHNRSGLVNGVILSMTGMSGPAIVRLIQSKVPGGLSNPVFADYIRSLP